MAGKYESKKNWFARHKIITVTLAVILALILLVVGYIWSKLSLIQYEDGTGGMQDFSSIWDTFEDEEEVNISGLEISETLPAIPNAEVARENEIINSLLIGTDERTQELNVNARSDSMILVSINKDKNTVKLVSLERAMGVPVLEGQYAGEWDLLTHIFRYGGAELLTKTVEYCFKVEVDHYVRLNFNSVTTAVDAVGGVDIDLSEAEAWKLSENFDVYLQPGINHLDGKMALSFARTRSIDSDWKRVERQRKVILAVVERLKGSSLARLNNLLDEVLPLIQTNMTMLEIADLMLYAPNFMMSTFDQMTIPKEGTYGAMTGLNGKPLFAVDFEVNNQILYDFLYGDGSTAESLPTE